MRKVILLLALVGVTACTPENDPVTVNTPGSLDLRATWQANLTGTAALAAARGTLQLSDYGAYFDAQLSVTSANPSTTYAWRIWPGTCTAPIGTLQYGPTQAYPNFATSATGAATLSRTISGPLNLSGTYHVRVTPTNSATTILACGNLTH